MTISIQQLEQSPATWAIKDESIKTPGHTAGVVLRGDTVIAELRPLNVTKEDKTETVVIWRHPLEKHQSVAGYLMEKTKLGGAENQLSSNLIEEMNRWKLRRPLLETAAMIKTSAGASAGGGFGAHFRK